MAYPTYYAQPQMGMQMGMQQPMLQPQPRQMMPRPMYGAPQSVPRVNGRPGADAYMIGPNEDIILLDANEDIFYYKAADAGGYAITQACRFERLPEGGTAPAVSYATREELEILRADINDLRGAISNGKQSRKARAEGDE